MYQQCSSDLSLSKCWYSCTIVTFFNESLQQLNHQSTVADLTGTVEGRDIELAKLRDKVNTFTVKLNEVKKELEVRSHEVIMVHREAKSRIQ